jgi:hypothetical protein
MLSLVLFQFFVAFKIASAQIDSDFLKENDPNELLRNALYQIDTIHFPNVTHLCEQEFLNFTVSLKNRAKWAEIGKLYLILK